ncbi:hypothetical protein LTR53_015714 [Teratosphaeriaceae sp. CCFEE 6253]|nr:hypothetical protein LTR53_015714 [Teratosphaeriaceae sp. CCFEE 6253]
MKTSAFALATLFSLALAAPIDEPAHARRQVGPSATPALPPYLFNSSAPYPTGVSPSGYQPSIFGTALYPTATGALPVASAQSTGTACSPDGALFCNGLDAFGLCDHGRVAWEAVASGTACIDGAITWAPDYPHGR